MSLLSRNPWSLHWTTLSNNLERNAKFDTGLKFFISPTSKPLFFNSGRITACLNSEGKQPETSDALNSRATKGDSRLRMSFISHVGTGSSYTSNTLHVPHDDYTNDKFPDGSREAANSYCRNPDESYSAGVWCYTTDPNTRWELCDVPLCGKSHAEFNRYISECVSRVGYN